MQSSNSMKYFYRETHTFRITLMNIKKRRRPDIENICLTHLQKKIRLNSFELNIFFNTQGGFVPSKNILILYLELSRRILSGTGGAYQRVNKVSEAILGTRIRLINEALYMYYKTK